MAKVGDAMKYTNTSPVARIREIAETVNDKRPIWQMVADAEFDEDQHPRDEAGKFTSGGGESSSNNSENPAIARYQRAYKTLDAEDKAKVDQVNKMTEKRRDAEAHLTMNAKGARKELKDISGTSGRLKYELLEEHTGGSSYNKRDVADLYQEALFYQDPPFKGEIKDISSEIKECKSVKECENLLRDQGYFHQFKQSDGSIYDTNAESSLKGMDLKSAQSVCQGFNKLYNEFPELAGQLSGVTTAKMAGRAGACWMTQTGTGGIRLNTNCYSDYEKFQEMHADWVKDGWSPAGTNADATLFHEAGHAIDNFLTIHGKGENDNPGKFSYNNRNKILEKCGYTDKDIPKVVSEYGSRSASEFFAESFSEYMNSPNPRPVAMETGRVVKEALKEWKERQNPK